MKVRLLKKYIPLIICLFILQADFVFAEGVIQQFLSFTSPVAFFDSIAAMMANAAMTVAGYLLSAAGYLLDISIQLTLNIKIFVSATPAIYTVWKNLRDITGLFFIFYLLYAAIQMMTGIGKDSYGTTIKNIVIAGVLINFSFFIVSVGIDASNITSQALYNAMRPNEVTVKLDKDTNLKTLVDQVGQSDISNIFMNSLRIQSIYDTKGNKLGTEIGNPIKTMLIGITGTIMMITTAASFILAALAFIARLVILLFLLAFSSIWFAAWALPNLQKFSSQFQGAFVSQLIFMPIYLLLMYVSLSIINGSRLFEAAMTTGPISGVDGARWIMPYVLLLVNFAIVIFILNLPLFVGLSMGGYATDWLKGSIGKWNAVNVWKNVGGWAKNKAATVPQNTVGQLSYMANKSQTMAKIAARSPGLGIALSKGLSKTSSASFGGTKGGYEGAIKARKKDIDALYKRIGDNLPNKDEKNTNQEKFRKSLGGGILRKLFDQRASSRAGREAAAKLSKESEKITNKGEKRKNEEKLRVAKEKLKDFDRLSHEESADVDAVFDEKRVQEERAKLTKEIDDLQEKIDKAEEYEAEEKERKMLEKVGSTVEEKGSKKDEDKGK